MTGSPTPGSDGAAGRHSDSTPEGTRHGPSQLPSLQTDRLAAFKPRAMLSGQHSSPEDSIAIHRDVRSKKSIGMHYGVFRGGVSQYHEPVTEPPERWKQAAEKAIPKTTLFRSSFLLPSQKRTPSAILASTYALRPR